MVERSILIWGLILTLGFPLLTVVLGEVIERLSWGGHPLTRFLRNLRRFVLPPLAILLLMRQILDVPDSARSMQVVETIFWFATIYTSISLLNVLLTSGRKQRSWQIHVPNLLFQVARASVILGIAAYVLADVWKVDLTEVVTALGVGSLVIALALQDTLSNLVSGFLLIFESPFKVGDWIRVKDLEGEVIEINWRAVRLRTWDRDVVIIPNGILGSDTIYNYTLLDPLHAVRVRVKFSFHDRPNPVKQLLKTTALATDGVVSNPEPEIQTCSCENPAIEYEVKFFIKDFATLERIRSEFLTRVYYAAKRNNLTIPLPAGIEYAMDIRPAEPGVTPEEIAESLRSLPYFIALESETIDTVAQSATLAYYGTGEHIVQTGEFDRGFYIVVDGSVLLAVKDTHGYEQAIAQLSGGDFFGEMVLLPGEPSPVSVIVIEDLKAIVIKPEAVIDLVQRNPRFALEMNQFIEERKKAIHLAKGMEDASGKFKPANSNDKVHSILGRLMDFPDS